MSKVMQGLAKALQDNGLKPNEVAERLSYMEPFCDHPELIAEIFNRGTS